MHISILQILLLLPSSLAFQCLQYRASMPFDDDKPFEATITEPHALRPLCWLKETYQEHNLKQTLANLFVTPEEKRKEESGKGDYATWGFKRWDMQCDPGIQAWVNVGLRTVQIVDSRGFAVTGKRQQTGFITSVTEDFYASAFIFTKDHNCEPPRTQAQVVAESRRVDERVQQRLNAAMRKIEATLYNGRQTGMSMEERRRQDDAKEIVRIALGGAPRRTVQLVRPGPQAKQVNVG